MENNNKKALFNSVPEPVYSFITSYYLHQDNLSWGRTQILFAIDAGTLAAAFAVKQLAPFTLLAGILLIIFIWLLIERDWEVRDQNLEHLDKVHVPLGIVMVKKPKYPIRRGSFILRLVFCVLIFINAILAIFFILALLYRDCNLLNTFLCA